MRVKVTALMLINLVAAVTTHAASYSPRVEQNFPLNVYWGDTHLHSSYSVDANMAGNMLPPEAAYRFAKGETVTASNGMKARLGRPLDFLVVSDHAEYLGVLPRLRVGGDSKTITDFGYRFYNAIMGRPVAKVKFDPDVDGIVQSTWHKSVEATENAYEPGRFTTLVGFEWSSQPGGNNLHRVVIFRDGPEKAGQVLPYSASDSHDPQDLWAYLHQYEQKTGGSVLAIPHNGNVSNGAMFTESLSNDQPIGRDYAAERLRWEPVIEVTQIKGDGETHPFLSPNDEFADYGTWDKGNLGATVRKETSMLQYEYARSALKLGLRLEERTGVNPYQFGLIGSTDSHTSLATADEDNFWGKASNDESGEERRSQGWFMIYRSGEGQDDLAGWYGEPGPDDVGVHSWEQLASGYAAVWATENTREAIFDALRRREVYATTGPRITVRFFGGWDFEKDDVYRSDYVRLGYQKGVPMGGELGSKPGKRAAPAFVVAALKDSEGANLDRIQVVKGWLDQNGEILHEKIYDVAWSGDRKPDKKGRLPAVGDTVDLKQATYSNRIGAAQLATVWRDPEFDPDQRAFYYVRVLEIPTPRWVVYDEKRLGARVADDAQRIHQERAYTSPIWYRPPAKLEKGR